MNRCVLVATACVACVAACSDPLVITCDPARQGAECLQGGISGECVATCDDSAHYCAFPAPRDCPETGLAYGALSANYSETCVETCALASDAGVADGGPDEDASPACEPRIAFISTRDSEDGFNSDVYTMKLDGTDQRRVTVDSTPRTAPLWSPDGRRILFLCGFDVCTVPTAGGANTFLTDGFDDTSGLGPSWSHDGSAITYTQGNSTSSQSFVMVMAADGSNKTPLTSSGKDGSSRFSPDGTKIAFVSQRDGNRDVYVMNADGSQQVNLTNDPSSDAASNDGPVWSPDGTRLLFVSDRDPNLDDDIYVVPVAGGPAVPLSARDGSDIEPAWSPAGSKIAWVRADGIYVMNSDGSGQIQVTQNTQEGQPTWMDEEQIVFGRYTGQNVGAADIYVVEAKAGGTVTRLTNDLHADTSPAFTPCARP